MLLVGGQHLPGVGFVHDEDMVQGLTLDAPDNPFAVGVHPGNSRRALEDLHLEDSVERLPVLAVAVKQQEPQGLPTPAEFGGMFRACCTAQSRVG
jgi:hypothetical protein